MAPLPPPRLPGSPPPGPAWHCCCFWGLFSTSKSSRREFKFSRPDFKTCRLRSVLFGQLVSWVEVAVVAAVVVGTTSPSIDFPQHGRSAAVVLVLLHQSRGQKFLSPENIARFIWTVQRENIWRTWSPFLEIIPVVRMRADGIFL